MRSSRIPSFITNLFAGRNEAPAAGPKPETKAGQTPTTDAMDKSAYRYGARANFHPSVRQVPTGPATIVIQNANVFTGVRGAPKAQAVAIQNDVILAVGTNEEIQKYITENTRVVNGKGRTVTPGFIETHGHLVDIAERAIGYVGSRADIAKVPPIDGWIRLMGPGGPSSREDFDKLTNGYPAYWESHPGSQSMVNSEAIEMAKHYWAHQKEFYGRPNPSYSKPDRLPSPPGGRVNESNGSLHYANNLFFDGRDRDGVLPDYEELGGVMPQMTYEVLRQPLIHTMEFFAANGITGFHNMMGTPQDLQTLGKLERDGLLTTRVYATQGMSQAKLYTMITPRFVALMDEVRTRFNSERLWTGMVKFNDSGFSTNDMAREVAALNAIGLQAAIHTHGDMLDAVEQADRMTAPGTASQLRHRLEHTMGDIRQANRLGTGGTIQFHAPDSELLENPEALKHWGAGTDWDVIREINPMRMIGMAAESLGSVEEALYGYTSNAAWLGHAENMVGTLEPGKKADVLLLNNDILSDPDMIDDTRPVMTIMDGNVIFEAGPEGDPQRASYRDWLNRVQTSGIAAAKKQGG